MKYKVCVTRVDVCVRVACLAPISGTHRSYNHTPHHHTVCEAGEIIASEPRQATVCEIGRIAVLITVITEFIRFSNRTPHHHTVCEADTTPLGVKLVDLSSHYSTLPSPYRFLRSPSRSSARSSTRRAVRGPPLTMGTPCSRGSDAPRGVERTYPRE
jgi:hypothetical protein